MNLLVDAFSFLVLGHVFVANMTGNVIFLGFALAGERAAPVLHVRQFTALIAALVILVAVMIAAQLTGRSNPAWSSEP